MILLNSNLIPYLLCFLYPLYHSYLIDWDYSDSTYKFPDNKISNVYLYNTKRIVFTYFDSSNNTMISIDNGTYIQQVSFFQVGSAAEKDGIYYICPKDKSKGLHIFDSVSQTMEEVSPNLSISEYYLICDFISFPIGIITTTYSNTTYQAGFIIKSKTYTDSYCNINFTDVFPLTLKTEDPDNENIKYHFIGIEKEQSNGYTIYSIQVILTYGNSFTYSYNTIQITSGILGAYHKYYTKTMNPYTFYFCYSDRVSCNKVILTIEEDDYFKFTSEPIDLSFIVEPWELFDLKYLSLTGNFFYFYVWDNKEHRYHEGIADKVHKQVIFSDHFPCKYFSNYLDSDMSFTCVFTKSRTYLFCPFSLSGESCEYCPPGKVLLLNYLDHNVCVEETNVIDNSKTNGMYKYCSKGYAYDGTNCIACKDRGYFTLIPEGSCVDYCEFYHGMDYYEKTCTICKDIFQISYDRKCLKSVPSHTFLLVSEYNVFEDCSSSCENCEDYPSNCLASPQCPYNYGIYNQECIICTSEGLYKYQNSEECIQRPGGTIIIDDYYNIIEDIEIKDHCIVSKIENNQAICIECEDSYFLYEDNSCTDSCGNLFYQDSTLKKCINCYTEYHKYKKENINECVDLPTDHGSFIVDSRYGIFAECYSTCASCVMEGSSTQQNCQTCVDGSTPINSNCETPCKEPLALYNGQCINCHEKGLYKMKGDGKSCIPFPGDGFTDVNYSYGIVEQCYSRCASCGEVGNDDDNKCGSCKEGYYLQESNCVYSCDINYVTDETKKKCINCWRENKYKIEGVNECIDSEIDGYYLTDYYFGILSKCDPNCKLCVNTKTNCIGCETGQYIYDATCVFKCPEKYGINDKWCSNCKKERMIKYQDKDECENIPTDSKFYYIDESFGIIANCTDDIEECKEEEDLISVINNIDYDILSYYNTSHSEMVTEQYTLQVYDTSTQKEAAANVSSISLGECEDILKKSNSIPSSEPLIIYTLDIVTNESSLVNEVKYSVFDIRGNPLDLSVCDDVGVNVSVPIKESSEVNITKMSELTDEGINIFNKSDPFFNDICVPYDSDDSAGLPFSKRKDLYMSSTVCSIGCELVSIDNTTNKANCKCGIKDAKATANQLKDKFSDTILNSNFFVVKCVNSVFNINNIKKNQGFFTFAGLFGCQLINILYFMITSVKPIKLVIMNAIDKGVTVANPIKKKNKNKKKKDSHITNDSRHIKRMNTNNLLIREENRKNNYVQQSPSEKKNLIHKNNSIKVYKTEDFYTSTRIFNETNPNTKKSYTEEELNDLSYDMAILYDTRSFCALYGNYLKYKQPILNAFIVETDTTLKSVKIAMLFLSIAMSFSFNALFFTESIQNKNYETNGNISFLVTLPKVILSCVASVIISTILSIVSSFDSKIKSIKEETNKEEIKQKVPSFLSSIKCKLTIFFVIMSILMIFFWYFVTAFCSVYPKYQNIWLKDSLKSLGLTMFFPFLYALGVTIFRYIGIKKKSSCSFCFAKVINII